MYSIEEINLTGDFKFKVTINDTDKFIVLNVLNDYHDYRKVNPKHYVNKNSGDIVLLEDINRIGTVIDGELYVKATQFEFDKWQSTIDMNSNNDNSKIYNKLMGL